MTYGWLRTNLNQEGIEIWELETEELFYHAPSNLIIGIFQKDLTNELYEKAKEKENYQTPSHESY